MNIGIDIDGVITDFENYVKEKGQTYLNKSIVNHDGDDIAELFSVPLSKEDDFWRDNIDDYAKKYLARKDASHFFKDLKEKGLNTYIITNRCRDLSYCGWSEDKMQSVIKDWLEFNNIKVDNIIYTHGSKLMACKENNVDIMLEDEPKHIKELAKSGIKVVKINSNYNKNCSGENIYTADSFTDALKIIYDI